MAAQSPHNLKIELLQVSHWPTRVFGLVATLAFTILGIVSFIPPNFFPTVLLFSLAAYSLYMFLSFGNTAMDSRRILHRSFFGEFEIKWVEVEAIETDPIGNTIVFKGKEKQLVVPGFAFWIGKDKPEMLHLFQRSVREYHIPLRVSALAAFAVSKNTKVE